MSQPTATPPATARTNTRFRSPLVSISTPPAPLDDGETLRGAVKFHGGTSAGKTLPWSSFGSAKHRLWTTLLSSVPRDAAHGIVGVQHGECLGQTPAFWALVSWEATEAGGSCGEEFFAQSLFDGGSDRRRGIVEDDLPAKRDISGHRALHASPTPTPSKHNKPARYSGSSIVCERPLDARRVASCAILLCLIPAPNVKPAWTGLGWRLDEPMSTREPTFTCDPARRSLDDAPQIHRRREKLNRNPLPGGAIRKKKREQDAAQSGGAFQALSVSVREGLRRVLLHRTSERRNQAQLMLLGTQRRGLRSGTENRAKWEMSTSISLSNSRPLFENLAAGQGQEKGTVAR
ncbi:hypothetical protein C8F04DRAFT_1181281 [Mycena alexandri]|uniref:Uncharacterized protein n=1 Tax=Mycena alexandri TaxID=1745969 RepID=A0AAD6X915_9AGAR|nr:hypothetical protein C8F04DRAFT_1181281 [Mycena alexandri]